MAGQAPPYASGNPNLKSLLFHLAAALSLIVGVAAAAMWVRSHWLLETWDVLGVPVAAPTQARSAVRLQVTSLNGGLGIMIPGVDQFFVSAGSGPPLGPVYYQQSPLISPNGYPASGLIGGEPWHGFILTGSATNAPVSRRKNHWWVTVPYWGVVATCAILPLLWLVRRRRDRAAPLGERCLQCGYDLRATPDRCPECGTVPQAKPGTATA